MTRRRILPLVLVVTALLAVVGVVAHGRPLSSGGGRGAGLPGAFWDYAFTTLLVVEVLLAVVAFTALFYFRRETEERQPYARRTAKALVILFAVLLAVILIGRHVDLAHLLHPQQSGKAQSGQAGGGHGKKHGTPKPASGPRHVHIRWDELAVVVGLLLVLGAVAARRSKLLPALPRHASAPEALAAALDESLDDLRADPDLRRAIVAAYARMEGALAAAGIPRRPAEAPLEYLERTLLSLDASAGAVRRLTELFEWARFSQHEPEPWMRDEAVDALVAVRDELRAPEPVAS